MTYDLRRLRLHGLIRRIPKTNRYQITAQGLKVAMFFSRTYPVFRYSRVSGWVSK
jgi:DNA-binding IclR family transcriptional regulator